MMSKYVVDSALKLVKTCPACGAIYKQTCVKLIEEYEDEFLVCISCDICGSSLLSKVIAMPFGLVGSAMLTDLKAEEVNKFRNENFVTADNVLEVYERLELNKLTITKTQETISK